MCSDAARAQRKGFSMCMSARKRWKIRDFIVWTIGGGRTDLAWSSGGRWLWIIHSLVVLKSDYDVSKIIL